MKVEAPEGALPEGVSLKLEDVKSEDYLNAIQEATRLDDLTAEDVLAVDITFLDEDSGEIEPSDSVKVSITKRGDETDISKTADIVHIKEDDKGEITKSEVVKTDDEKASRKAWRTTRSPSRPTSSRCTPWSRRARRRMRLARQLTSMTPTAR